MRVKKNKEWPIKYMTLDSSKEIIMESAATPPVRQGVSMAEQMKNLAKLRMERAVFSDPAKARELVKTQATATYNASANLVQATVTSLGSA